MSLPIETGSEDNGLQTIRLVADVIDNCNLGCHYCHPNMGGWGGETLGADQVGDLLQAAEDRSLFEVTLTGGEITMHPEFGRIMDETHRLGRTALSVVTNATLITPEIVDRFAESRIDRLCVSVDGPDAESHNSRRGRNFDKVMTGLEALQDTSIPITVISVVHKQNYPKILQLSERLASDGLADEHHLCAPSYSGAAKRVYDRFALEESDFHKVQDMVDGSHEDFLLRGLYTTFNSYWPATGKRGKSSEQRTMTLIQFTEQVKNIYPIVRPNGDVRLTVAAWGRETVGPAVVGNVHSEPAGVLLDMVDAAYRDEQLVQLPRAIEAGHKFHVGPYRADLGETNLLLQDDKAQADDTLEWRAVRQLSRIDLLDNPVGSDFLRSLAHRVADDPARHRVVRHASGVDIVYDRRTSHMTVLKPEETGQLARYF